MKTSDISIHAWITENAIKNEKGDPITFKDHIFLFEMYRDKHANFCCKKCAQVGLSTLEILKNHFDAKSMRMDIIYTLPADNDVSVFVGGKVNRIIQNNPCMLADVADKDSIEQKAIGQSMEYFRGTWTKKSAIMITADRLVHDEKDSSKQDVVADYQSRTQHSTMKQTHVLSHPSVPNQGVDQEWQMSDMKEWFITCGSCGWEQFLSWDVESPRRMSVDIANKQFICKKCRATLSDDDRAIGRWIAKHPHTPAPGKNACNPETCREWSGYHVSLLMAPWVTAAEIVAKYNEVVEGKQTMEFFFNKVLGEPYAGSGNVMLEEDVMGLVTKEPNLDDGRMVMGVDTGIKLRYVIGNKAGIMSYGEMEAYSPDEELQIPLEKSLEYFLKKFPELIMVVDQGGDIVGSRQLQKKYPGRVFLCHYATDRKTQELIRWGKSKEFGTVNVDRNRMIQLVVDEAKARRFFLFNAKKEEWYDYWLHWSHIYRVWNDDNELGLKKYEWRRNGRDDWVHATVYWRVGLSKFAGRGEVSMPNQTPEPNSYLVEPNQTVAFNPEEMFDKMDSEDEDWR